MLAARLCAETVASRLILNGKRLLLINPGKREFHNDEPTFTTMQYNTFFWFLLELTGCSVTRIIATDQVPLLGPSFISNFNNSKSRAIQEAKSEFPNIIESLFSPGDLNRTGLIFAFDIFSASINVSIYEYYHVGEGQEYALSSGRLDDQTVSRIGSVSKLLTVYAIIAQAGIEVFSRPVMRYLPDLAGNSTSNSLQRIKWNDITIGALLFQQAGSGGPGGISSREGYALSKLRALTCVQGFFEYTGGDVARQTSKGIVHSFQY